MAPRKVDIDKLYLLDDAGRAFANRFFTFKVEPEHVDGRYPPMGALALLCGQPNQGDDAGRAFANRSILHEFNAFVRDSKQNKTLGVVLLMILGLTIIVVPCQLMKAVATGFSRLSKAVKKTFTK